MACVIDYREKVVLLNNKQFYSVIDFMIEVGVRSSQDDSERAHVQRLEELSSTFWPGRGMDIEKDFPDLAERKFWARVCFDTARAIFERTVGRHEHTFWQAQRISQVYGTALLLEESVRDVEPGWSARTLDRAAFEGVMGKGDG